MAKGRKQEQPTDMTIGEGKDEVQKDESQDIPRKYFVGTIDGSPFQNITIGGICFPNFTNELIRNDENTATIQSKRRGDILELYDYEVKRIREAASKKIIRWNPAQTRAFIVSIDDKYRKGNNDEPISKYIYLIPLEQVAKDNPMWRETSPLSLVTN